MPALIGSQFNLWQGTFPLHMLRWKQAGRSPPPRMGAALLAGPPPEVGELFKRKPG
jgi:hypothetical protein